LRTNDIQQLMLVGGRDEDVDLPKQGLQQSLLAFHLLDKGLNGPVIIGFCPVLVFCRGSGHCAVKVL
jgi:hypothetical protein